MVYWTCFYIMKLLNAIYFNAKYCGLENLPSQGSFIIASNHISNIDPFILGICRKQKFSFLAKEAIFKRRLIGWIFRQMGAFPVKRDTADFGAMREALRRLKKGMPLILFPEGTRGVGDRVKKAQPGIGFLATKGNVPVVPVYLKDTDKAFPNDAKWVRRHPVSIRFGKPVDFGNESDYAAISDRILKDIQALSLL